MVRRLMRQKQVIFCESLIKEIRGVAMRPELGIERFRLIALIALVRRSGIRVIPSRVRADSPGPKDDFVIAMVRKGKPKYLISGNLGHVQAAISEGAKLLTIGQAVRRFDPKN